MKTRRLLPEKDPVLTTVENISTHLLGLSETLSATEDFMTEHFHDILSEKPHALEDLQRLDFLNQSIIDTARLLRNIGDGLQTADEMLHGLQMEATRALVGLPSRPLSTSEDVEGDVQLF